MSFWWIVPVGAAVAGLAIAALGARRGRGGATAIAADASAMATLHAEAAQLRADADAVRERLADGSGGADRATGSG